jgi:hypothetical protein
MGGRVGGGGRSGRHPDPPASIARMVRNPLKPGTRRDEVLYMSDLSNLLGDVYGDHSPDDAPVRREPSAVDRAYGGGEDLTAALSAALNAEVPNVPAPLPVAPAPAVNLTDAATNAGWAASPAAPSMSVSAPVPAMAGGGLWAPGDDDIFPRASKKKK